MTFSQWNRLVVLAVLLLAASVLASAGQSCAKSKQPLPGSTFSEPELQRYKVTLKAETPDSGVETGVLIVSGCYVPPPYMMTVHGGEAYVNGVLVYPTPRAVPRPRDEQRLCAIRASDAWRITESLRAVADSGVRFYEARLALGADTTTALKAAESLMKTQPGVLWVGFSTKFECHIHGRTGTWPGGMSEQIKYHMLFPRQRRPQPAVQISPDSVARMTGVSVMRSLRLGSARVLGGGEDLSMPTAGLADIVRVMTIRNLSPSQRWERLLGKLGIGQAYACVANYEASRPGWDRLAAKLGVKPDK